MSIRTSVSLVVTTMTLILPVAARAAGPEFCEAYAHAAETQVRAGLSHPGCAGGMRGSRWTADYRVHYDWCRQTPAVDVEAERDARTAYLRACR